MEKIIKYIKRIISIITTTEMSILPGHLAFNIVLTIIPIFSFVGVLGSNFVTNDLINGLDTNVPNAVLEIIRSALMVESNGFNLVIFSLFSIWLASGACRAIIIASNTIYKVQGDSFLKQTIKSIFMILILFLLITFIIAVPVLGDTIIGFLTDNIRWDGISIISKIYHYSKYPLTIILIYISIKLLYTMSPDKRIGSKYMNFGAWFTTLSWFVATRFYSYQLNNYSNYNLYYGSLSNILILLVWVYLLAYLFIVGMAFNADYYLAKKDKNIDKKEK